MTEVREVLHQILNVPGAIGALAYTSEGTILAQDFPGEYAPDVLRGMAKLLAEDLMVQQALAGEEGGLDFSYSSGRLVIRAFPRGAILALCGGAANLQLVRLALAQAAHRLGKPSAEPSKPVAAPAAPPATMPDPSRYSALGALKDAFLVRIGPIGDLLFSRIHADWSADPGARGLGDFAARLGRELDDPADQKAFLQEARAILD